ncbi:glycosyltransferase family 4 protein [Nitrososphaera viennensis]|uniref:Glycosyltransferase subfamily 4-like N-terminal domain-containing protein n=2 Tax=Nitrososphaera viennensis TaxID=1034015 RepID=A0A060HSK7_9ARCH|nr:glycosyltransferase family 4 protein [Nitrososphaera viennensis]AIC16431.1 hypothetical protein NVIE_021710 [Nitrososphaera viennensis EN76]UVS68366.1 glycosyltransferase family 4 protein [Nitrososphaera viennensis]
MKIAFVVTHLSYGSPGSFVRVQEIARHLDKLGVATTILTPFEEDLVNVSDVKVEFIPSSMSKIGLMSTAYKLIRKTAYSRLTSGLFLSEGSFTRMASIIEGGMQKILQKQEFDILHAVQPIAALACSALANKYDIPLVSDIHNDWPEEIAAQGLCKRDDNIYRFLHDVKQKIIDLSDAVTVVSEELKKYFVEKYRITSKPIVVVPPGGPIVSNVDNTIRERNVVYAGMVNYREHVDLFARSIPFVKEDATFYISDYGDSIKNVKNITKKIDQEVNYVWFKKRQEVLGFLLRSKLGILTSHDDITRQLGPPLKLYDYMACGLPVIANDIGGWSKMIEDEKIGLLSKDDPKHFARCIDDLLSNESLWKEMHENTLHLIGTKYKWENVAKNELIPLYKRLTRDI